MKYLKITSWYSIKTDFYNEGLCDECEEAR